MLLCDLLWAAVPALAADVAPGFLRERLVAMQNDSDAWLAHAIPAPKPTPRLLVRDRDAQMPIVSGQVERVSVTVARPPTEVMSKTAKRTLVAAARAVGFYARWRLATNRKVFREVYLSGPEPGAAP